LRIIAKEIRDEGATGQGSKPKVGLCGFSVSNLKIDGAQQPWEVEYGKPSQIVSYPAITAELSEYTLSKPSGCC
jgi:phosphoribosylformylglycinamidine (FGAM) synthase-like enzyme